MRELLITIVFTLFIQLSFTQSSTISGVVKNEKGVNMPFVPVTLMEPNKSVTTDENGYFKFTEISSGQYHLQITALGYKQFTKIITVKEGEDLDLSKLNLQEEAVMLNEMVITATRTQRTVEDVPIPVTVISGEDIESMGSMRLSDVLAEQTGLTIISDHGSGIQMQGLDSDYTMVMINGQPVVGRTGGTLDLSRITVNNIKQIEITKGPSSSLYGSEALAGVINIITEEPEKSFQSSISTKYRTYNTLDITTDVQTKKDDYSAYLQLNRYSSEGYDLTPESISKTSPEFENYTVNGSFSYDFNEKAKANLNARFFTERQSDKSTYTDDADVEQILNFDGHQNDWNVSPSLTYNFTPHTKVTLVNYTMAYNTKSDYFHDADGSVYEKGFFNQLYNRTETQADITLSKTNVLTLGAGHIIETLKSDRYEGLNKFNTTYGFVQDEWTPFNKKLTLLTGARFDAHSEYASQFSPKIAAQYKINRWINVKGSFGTGFKAPDFRQLFLDFTNPSAGYSVFGSTIVKDGMQELLSAGQIQTILVDYRTIETIKAENSVSYNIGLDIKPHNNVLLRGNFFRNDIQDLIETSPIAIKTNGQQVYSYFNINRVYTQGVEGELRVKLKKIFRLSFGYQYLEARDKDVEEQLRNGKVYARDADGSTVIVKPSQYGGLFNRSKHSGTAKIFYTNTKYKLDISLRSIYRGAFGYGDVNGNSILDTDSEYTKGYFTWHFSVIKRFMEADQLSLQFGVDNLFAATNEYVPTMPGRFVYGALTFRLSKSYKDKKSIKE